MKKIKIALLVSVLSGLIVAALAPAIDAAGHIGIFEVKSYLRTRTSSRYVWQVAPSGSNVGATSGILTGVNGVLAKPSLGTGSTGITQVVWTSSIAGVAYPCSIKLTIRDQIGTANTITCSAASVSGWDQFGGAHTESFTTLVEGTAKETSYAYARVDKVTATGCNGGINTADILQVNCGKKFGLPFPLSNITGVRNACLIDASDSSSVNCYKPAAISEDIDITYNTIDVSGLGTSDSPGGSFTATTGDSFSVDTMAPAGY